MMNASKLTIVAPSRSLVKDINCSDVDHERIDVAKLTLETMGWSVTEAANIRNNVNRFAGTDLERAQGFVSAMLDPECDVVMCLRGGYGAARLLPLIDWNRLRESQAAFIGLSDTTALNLALFARAGRPSWQGPTAARFATATSLLLSRFQEALTAEPLIYDGAVQGEDSKAQGILWGGNLSILVSLLGTPYFPLIEGGILYVEDIGEPAWRIERMLLQLDQSGVLRRQSALLIGDMQGSERASGEGDSHFGLKECLSFIRKTCSIPVIEGLPFGHIAETMMMPFGVQAELLCEKGVLKLTAAHPPVPACTPWTEAPRSLTWWQ